LPKTCEEGMRHLCLNRNTTIRVWAGTIKLTLVLFG
jgi:hypothetical protein